MQLADACRQTRRTGLQDVSRFHFKNAVLSYGDHLVPPRPGANDGLLHFLTAPRREDHFWIAPGNFRGRDDTIACKTSVGQFREDRRAAGNLDELLDPSEAGNNRLAPLLEERAKAAGKSASRLANPIEVGCEVGGERFSSRLTPDQPTKHSNHLQDLGDAALVECDDGQATANELRREIGLEILEGQDGMGAKRLDLLAARVL